MKIFHTKRERSNLRKYSSTDVVLQNNHSLVTMLWGRSLQKGLEYDGLSDNTTALLDNGRALFFTDAMAWIAYLKKRDFVAGTRIHGNIAALLAGTRGFVFATDSRTRELSEFFNIPHCRIDQVGATVDVASIVQAADYGPLVRSYPKKFSDFKSFLAKNGLDNCFNYPGLADKYERALASVERPTSVMGVRSGVTLRGRYLMAKANAVAWKFAQRVKRRV